MATQKQIEANRINATKSTGPKSPEGKAASKLNRLTHGLRAEEHVLPGEDPEEFRAFVDAWVEDWNPTTMARRELVEEAAISAWRRKRCRRVEAARIARRVHAARIRQGREERVRVARAAARLFDDPERAREGLMGSRAGVDRLVALWSEIERASRAIGDWVDNEAHHLALIALRGALPDDPPEDELGDVSWALYVRNVPEDREAEDDADPIDDAEATAIAGRIGRLAAGHLAWLSALRASLPDPLREAEAAAFDPRPEDASLLRYEAHLSREFHRSLGSLVKLTKSGDDLVEESHADAPNEPNLEAEPESEEEVTAEAESAEPPPEERQGSEERPGSAVAPAARVRAGHSRPVEAVPSGPPEVPIAPESR